MTFRFSQGRLHLKPLGTVQQLTRASSAGLNLDPNWVVLSVIPDGPAAQAGLRSGDKLLEIAGRPLEEFGPAEFAALKQLPPGTTVRIRYRRGAARPAEVEVVLTAR